MNNLREDVGPSLTVLRWTIATILGWFLGIILILSLSSLFDGLGIESLQFFVGLGIGTGVGVAQWRILRRFTSIGSEWIWSTALGMGIPFLVFDLTQLLASLPQDRLQIPMSVFTGSLVTGIWQSRIIRSAGFVSTRWMPASAAGWLLSAAAIFAIDYTKHLSDNNWVLFTLNLLLILAGGPLLGASTGREIVKFVRFRTQD